MITYFDTSALVKTIVAEPGADVAVDVWNASDVRVASIVAYAEARSALAAATRDRRLVGTAPAQARAGLDARWSQLVVAAASDDVVHLAGDLADREPLRGYDAVHLATALLAGDDDEVLFMTWDRALLRVARRIGVSTNDPV